MQKLTIIVPAYNEKENIRPFYEAVEPFLKNPEYESKYLFIDDGSYDGTLEEIKKLREEDSRVNFISFSRNCGKEAAMQAGLKASLNEDCVIMMDSDLQHPPYLIEEMLKKREEGYKIAYTRQKSRKGDKGSNRFFAHMFYAIFNKYSDVGIEQSVKDYMLLDKAVVKAFVDMPDEYRFTRGIFSYVGFKKTCLEFDFVKRTFAENNAWYDSSFSSNILKFPLPSLDSIVTHEELKAIISNLKASLEKYQNVHPELFNGKETKQKLLALKSENNRGKVLSILDSVFQILASGSKIAVKLICDN